MPNLSVLRDTWRNLDPRGQLTLVGSALLVIVTMFALYHYASRPSYTTIESGLNPSDTGRVTQALDSSGVSYKIGSGGTEVSVLSTRESQARIAIASSGAASGDQVGLEIFDKQKLGATGLQQQVDYQRGLQGEIERTIEDIEGVTAANVAIVLPKDSLFADKESQASAAVMITGGTALDASTVRGVAHLVASSVQGLDPENVTITDDTGSLLWPSGDSAGGAPSTGSKLSAEQRYDSQASAEITSMLASTLGAGKAQVRVHADLNVDQATVEQTTFDKKGVPLTQQKEKETLQGGGASAPGVAGATTNTPPYAAGTGANGGNSNYNHTIDNTTYGVSHKVEKITKAPGSVNRLNVSVLVDSSIKGPQLTAVKSAVAAMAGIDPKRGDAIAVSSLPFAKPQAAPGTTAGPLGIALDPLALARWAALGLGLAAFVFMMRRSLKRREGEGIAPQPTWLREIEQRTPIAQLHSSSAPRIESADQARRDNAKREATDIVKKRPDQMAQQVVQWMNEG
jgi:flagellar M-ring protein FliF